MRRIHRDSEEDRPVYGLLGGVLIASLKMVEYRFLVLEHSLEIYGGIAR